MKAFKRFLATVVAGVLSFPYLLMAQDEGTYIDNLGVQDSSYMDQDLLAEGAQSSGSGNTTVIIIVIVVIVIAVAGYLAMKKKKK
ncbi:LPXTG-motif cell wall anchor domain-containing protein [Mariniphaga anaerophila]|uniref:LPXTG-motif cell wall anchor domain-containing protein n=1 Tax=Mariniphaga anaerophila TaxID=1484053 RepID=A0A1M4YPA3_9BACT|nr:LPXTG cell wall anchor domain-containing protein [Mariniphaga anaerophila]SHF07600.1 LPXTG-motif cell wall anchor domain-containing protein [Mariniphaga anaerophila]